jgi:hypothetical protein
MLRERLFGVGRVCPKTGKRVILPTDFPWILRWLVPLIGLVSLVWFLIRVVPKPSRYVYPCQRVAAPLAGGFVVWLAGIIGSAITITKARQLLGQSRLALACVCLLMAVGGTLWVLHYMPDAPVTAAVPGPNVPIGVAKGINPGRVVWVHDPNANDWDGSTGYYSDPNNLDQDAVDAMMSRAVRALTDEATDADAWDALFRHYNTTHGRGDVGYTAGEGISIKVNLVNAIQESWMNLPTSYDQIDARWKVNTSTEVMLALLRQLIYAGGVPQADISIGDTVTCFPNHLYTRLHDEFPNVVYLDKLGVFGRTLAVPSNDPNHEIHWSDGVVGSYRDYMPQAYVDATYHINLSDLKGHEGGGVTLCGKNYYGSMCHTPDAARYRGGMHTALPYSTAGYNRYRTLVDLLGHPDTGGKGLLYLIDGLWSGYDAGSGVIQWNMPPFNGDWPSSLFVSQDPVAVDSVGYDFLYSESAIYGNSQLGFPSSVYGADDYIGQAASSTEWPAGITYDPDGDGTPIGSLGTHEHWNNPVDKQYSRNLGTGDGIELVALTGEPLLVSSEPVADGTWCKTQNNVMLLTFDAPITLPGGGAPALSIFGGAAEKGNGFAYSVEPDGVTLRAVEGGAVLTNLTWYHITPAAGFAVQPFGFDVCALYGDANGSGRVTTADYSEVKSHMTEYTDACCDLNGSGRVTTADYGVVKGHLGNRTPVKP